LETQEEFGWGEKNLTLMHAKDKGWGAIFQAHTIASIINEALVKVRLLGSFGMI
jgi:hypothetical protein